MMYSDDARLASLKVTRHHGLQVWEQMAGVGWWETDRLVAFGRMSPDNKELKFKRPGLRGSGQHVTLSVTCASLLLALTITLGSCLMRTP